MKCLCDQTLKENLNDVGSTIEYLIALRTAGIDLENEGLDDDTTEPLVQSTIQTTTTEEKAHSPSSLSQQQPPQQRQEQEQKKAKIVPHLGKDKKTKHRDKKGEALPSPKPRRKSPQKKTQ